MSDQIQKTGEKKLTPLDAAMRPIISSSPNIAKLLPPGLNLDRFIMQVKVALSKNPGLQSCTPASLIGAVLEAADLGLDPSGRLGSAYLIPFKGVVTLVPGYRGLIDLACRSGMVRSINAYVVHEKDEFSIRAGYTPIHVPYIPRPGQPASPGAWYAVWARARMVGGAWETEVMTRAEVEAVKAKAPGSRSAQSPWNGTAEDQEEMAKKTVIRRLLKKLPLSPTANWEKLSRALDLGDGAQIEGEHRQLVQFDEAEMPMLDQVSNETVEAPPSEKKSTAEELKNKL